MIFKTWITDLAKIQGVINNIKCIELWANGATGLLNPNVVNNLSSAISGLNLQQAQLALSTRSLTQEQMHQVLVQAGLIASEDKIQAELLQSALAQSNLSAEKQKAILMDLGLINKRTLEVIATKACTKEELLNALATKGVTGANAEAIISALGLSGANGTATISFELLTASIWANIKALVTWLATNPVGWCVLAAAAIFGAVKAFDALTVSFDEAVEKTKSSKEELDNLTSEISSLNEELKTTKDRIEELLEKANSGTISLLEEEELNGLREQNDELQREIALKEKLAEIDAKEAAENAAYSLTYRTDDDHWDGEYNATDRIDKLQKYVDTASYYQDKISEVNQQIEDIEESATDNSYKNDSVYKNLIKQQEKYQDELQKTEGLMSSTYKELASEDDGLYYNGKVLDGYEDLIERLNTVYMAVELYLNDGNIKDTTEKYVETIKNKLIESGLSEEISSVVAEGFSEEELDSIMNSDSIDWSQCLGLEDATAVIENIREQLASVGNINETPILFPIDTYKDQIDNFQSNLKTLGDALTSIRSGSFENSDLADLLQEFPELADKSDDLESALVELINNSLKVLYDTLGEEVPDGLKVSLQELADIASGTAMHLGDAFSSIHDSWDILQDFKDTMEAGFDDNITDSLLQSVRGLSGELETLVAGYYSGIVTAEELYKALTEHYENDLHNYSEALIKKNDLNTDFYNAVGMASEEVVNQFMDDYDIDLENCKTYNQAKLEIEKQTLGQISALWSQYYDAQSKTLKMSMSEIEARAAHGGGDAAAFLEQYKLIENFEAAMEALNNITYDGIRSNFESISSKLNVNSSSSSKSSSTETTKEFSEELNWVEKLVNKVSTALDKLKDKVSNTYIGWSIRNYSLSKAMEKTNDAIVVQQQAYEKYMQKAASVGLSQEYINKIQDGTLDIETITDEVLSEQIENYTTW